MRLENTRSGGRGGGRGRGAERAGWLQTFFVRLFFVSSVFLRILFSFAVLFLCLLPYRLAC